MINDSNDKNNDGNCFLFSLNKTAVYGTENNVQKRVNIINVTTQDFLDYFS